MRHVFDWQDLVARWNAANADLSESYRANVRRTVRDAGAYLPPRVALASRAAVAGWLAKRRPAKARADLRHLTVLGRWAWRQGWIQAVPFAAVQAPPGKPVQRKRIRLEDLPGLLKRLPAELRPPVLWIMLTGCRSGEACGLTAAQVGAEAVTLAAKGGHQPAYLLDAPLRAVLAQAARWKGKRSRRSSAVFVTRLGRSWTPTALAHRIREVWPPGITLHCLRHLWGTEAGRRYGADMVQAVLGHRSRASAIPYIHTSEDARVRADGAAPIRSTILAQIGPISSTGDPRRPSASHAKSAPIFACPNCGKPLPESLLRKIMKRRKGL